MREEMIMNCAECGTDMEGRVDKKFCSDYCRNAFNNKLNRDSNKYIRNINNTLRKNRRILEAKCPGEKSVAHKDELLFAGFNFDYYTNTYVTKAGTSYFFCYDYGYLALDDEKFAIVKRGEYVK